MASMIEKFFETQVSFKTAKDVIENEILKEQEKLREIPNECKAEETKRIAKGIKNKIFEIKHPVVEKLIDWGNLKGRTKYAEELEQILENLVSKEIKREDYDKLGEKIEEFKRGLMGDIERLTRGERERDLRPLHVPGSVGRDEARNLYFGEEYDKGALYRLAMRLLESVCFGSNIAIYFDNQELREDIRKIFLREFGSCHVVGDNLNNLKVHPLETRSPYIILMKFLLWLYKYIEADQQWHRIIDLLEQTEGVIYLTPGNEKVNYSTIPLPRLDIFCVNWLMVAERRKALEEMKDSLFSFMREIEKSAKKLKRQKAAQNELRVLVTYYDMLCFHLLQSGFINHEPLRRIIDIALGLSQSYGVDTSFSFVRELTLL